MKKENTNEKMTLEEYQKKHKNPKSIENAKRFLTIFSTAITLAVITCLLFIVLRLFEIHEIAGYVGIVLAVVIFIFAFFIPMNKLRNMKTFMTDVDETNVRQAKKYNKKLRAEIADKMIDIDTNADILDWYTKENIGKLAIARHTKNDEDVKHILTEIYQTDVKKASNKMITKAATKIGVSTAISQSDLIDTLLVIIYELNLIKDIVFLYGYRPSDAQLAKIYKNVITNALIAFGVSSASAGVGQLAVNSFTNIPFVGKLIESGIQGVVNTTFAVIVGNQTKKYLVEEYKLQDMLDHVNILDTPEEEEKLMESIAKEVKKKTDEQNKNMKKTKTKATVA